METQPSPSVAPISARAYKALPLEERLALALREHLSEDERLLILHHEQWMQVRCYFARRADLAPNDHGGGVAATPDDERDFGAEGGG